MIALVNMHHIFTKGIIIFYFATNWFLKHTHAARRFSINNL